MTPSYTTPSTHNPLTLWSWTPWTSSSSPRGWCHRYDDLGGLPRISASVAPAASACFGTPTGLCPHVLWFLRDKGSVDRLRFSHTIVKTDRTQSFNRLLSKRKCLNSEYTCNSLYKRTEYNLPFFQILQVSLGHILETSGTAETQCFHYSTIHNSHTER